MSRIIQCLCFRVWRISPNIMSSWSVQVVAQVGMPFLLELSYTPLPRRTPSCSFLCLLMGAWIHPPLGCGQQCCEEHEWTRCLIEFLLYHSFVSIPRSGIIGLDGNSIFNLLMNHHTISVHRLLDPGGSSETHTRLLGDREMGAQQPSLLPACPMRRWPSQGPNTGISLSASGTFKCICGNFLWKHGNSVHGDTRAQRVGGS